MLDSVSTFVLDIVVALCPNQKHISHSPDSIQTAEQIMKHARFSREARNGHPTHEFEAQNLFSTPSFVLP